LAQAPSHQKFNQQVMGQKTSEEREETMKRIIKKQYIHILDPKEKDAYDLMLFKVT